MGNIFSSVMRWTVLEILEEEYEPVTLKASAIQEPPKENEEEKVDIKELQNTHLDLKKGSCIELENENKEPLSPKDKPQTQPLGPATKEMTQPEVPKPICGICFKKILKKKNWDFPIYVLLMNCDHLFCFNCIKRWREEVSSDGQVQRSCPMCRTVSELAIISTKLPETVEERKQMLARINCTPQVICDQSHIVYVFSKGEVVWQLLNT